jgi:DNA-binding MarR family transcriptional regulator
MLMHHLMQGYSQPDSSVKLNHTQWKTLFILSFIEKPSMSQMCKSINLEKGSFTSVVDGLIEKELVCRIQDPSDRRKILLELTEQGRELVIKGKKNMGMHIQSKLDALEPGDVKKLFNALADILTIAEKL